jgi:hypothetical protein
MLAKHALSQLSYGPVTRRRMLHTGRSSTKSCHARLRSVELRRARFALLERGCATRSRRRSVVGLGRLELPTSRLSSARSNQLSYKPLTRGAAKYARSRTAPDASHKRQALGQRVRPRRKRNEDGEIPPVELNDLAIDWPLMFLKRSDSERELSEGSSLERR